MARTAVAIAAAIALAAGVAHGEPKGERALVRAGVTITQEQIESGAVGLRETQRQGASCSRRRSRTPTRGVEAD